MREKKVRVSMVTFTTVLNDVCIKCVVWQDECSFVSLRDVERAMLVFVYFFEKMDLFRDAMNRKESKEKGIKDGERRISIPVSPSADLLHCG